MAPEVLSCFPGVCVFFFFFCSKESFYIQELAEKLEEYMNENLFYFHVHHSSRLSIFIKSNKNYNSQHKKD